MSCLNFGSWFYDIVTLSQFCRNSVVAKNSQPINRRYVVLNHDLNQLRRSVTELAADGAARQSSASTIANGYQGYICCLLYTSDAADE